MTAAQTNVLERATVEDLLRAEGKAELIDGRLVETMTGSRPNEIAGEIYASLRQHVKKTRVGMAYTDGMGFLVPLLASGRESFSPDARITTVPCRKTRCGS